MTKNPLLSIITINKNDLYYENQLPRIKFILNYFIYSLKKMDAINKVEYIIVDWGSNEPFSNYFHKEISMSSAIKFINVPKEETKKCELSFDVSKALNIGIENSSGKHVMLISGSDVFFPLSVFNNLLTILEKPEIYGLKGNEYKLVPRKFLEDDFFIHEKSMETIDLYLQNLNHCKLPFPDFPLNSGGGTGGNLLKKKQWLQMGGIKDTKKHNRGQDLINLHETSKICSHIDIATFGSFLLKLPRTNLGARQVQVDKIKNPLDYLTFEKNESIINSKNIEIINNLNLPKKNLVFNTQLISEKKNFNTAKEIIKTIIDCASFINFSGTSLKSQDIQFISSMKEIIKRRQLKNIICDERQASRFATCLAKCFLDLKFIIFMDPGKNTSLDVLKFRTSLTDHINKRNPLYYGHIKVVEFAQDTLKFINKAQDVCIMQDNSSVNFSYFKNEFNSVKINTIRKSINNTNTVMYNIEDELVPNQKNKKTLTSTTFINLVIFTLLTLRKAKKFLGNFKRKLQNYNANF